jgi:hypothetical protein
MTHDTDIDVACEFVALAIDPAVPFTAAINRIAERVAELRISNPSPVASSPGDGPPGSGGSPTPLSTAPGGTEQ